MNVFEKKKSKGENKGKKKQSLDEGKQTKGRHKEIFEVEMVVKKANNMKIWRGNAIKHIGSTQRTRFQLASSL